MPEKSVLTPQNVGISVLGGIAAAAIGAVVVRGGLGGLVFAHLAPLPLLIVALGFGVVHGATAALTATIILSLALHPVIGMGYALLIAAPAWLAAYVASGAPRNGRDFITRHVTSSACLSAAGVLAGVVILWLIVATISFGSLEEALNPIRARAFIILDAMLRDKDLPEGRQSDGAFRRRRPLGAGVSRRLRRPYPYLPISGSAPSSPGPPAC